MSYIDKNLMNNETVVFRAKVSLPSQLGLILLGIFIVILALIGKEASIYISLLGLIPLGIALINIVSTELAFTNKRIIAKTGFISRHTIELKLNRIESLSVKVY